MDDILNIDEFLPIGTGEDLTEKKPTVFTKEKPFDASFLEEKEEVEEEEEIIEEEGFESVVKNLDTPSEEEEDVKPKGLDKTFGKLFEKGILVPFDDDKPLEEYSAKDWQELIEANVEEKSKEIEGKIKNEFFDSLPEELQQAAKYVMDGGRDLKSLFSFLAQREEVVDLDPNVEEDQEIILRQFLSTTNFGTKDEIDEQIESWKEAGQLEKWAKKHKPKLDQMYSKVIEKQLAEQERLKEESLKRKEQYLDSVYNTLKKGELNGIKIDAKKQKFLWEEMTQTKYESLSGRPTNLLGHLLEKYQFGDEPRYDLVTEALWLLQDPEGYKEEISKIKVQETVGKTVRTLKTEQNRKNSATQEEEPVEQKTRKIQRPQKNIFARN